MTLLAYVFGLLLVGGLLFLVASFAFGRGEEMVPVLPEGTPLELPDDRPAGGRDLRELRLSVVARGYRMDEVDWLLDRLAEQVDARDREIARLRSVLHVEPIRAADAETRPARGRTLLRDDAEPDWSASAADPDEEPGRAGSAADRDEESGWSGPAADREEEPGWSGSAADRDEEPGRAGAEDPAGPDAEAEWSRPDEDDRR